MTKFYIYFILIFLSIKGQAQTKVFDSLKSELKTYKLMHPKDANDRRVVNLLDSLYNQNLQTNLGLTQNTINEYEAVNTSKTVKNKSIFYLFKKYQDYIADTAAKGKTADTNIQIAIMNLLARECIEIHNEIPAIVSVYMGEALISAGMKQKAKEHFELSLKFYKDSIPIQVYLVLLEPQKNKKLKKKLLRKHSEHWMVRSMLH